MTIFIDSSFLIALFHKKDDFHSQAQKITTELMKKSARFFVSNIVVAETINFIFRLKGPKTAQKFKDLLVKSGLEEVFVDSEIFQKGYQLLFRQKSKAGLNFFDCLHLETMKKLGISKILTFDQGFEKLKPELTLAI